MATWVISNHEAGIQAITETSTARNHPLGKKVKATDISLTTPLECEFIYLKGLGSTAVGTVVHYNLADGSTALAAANAVGPVAVSMSANVANQYGWYQIYGLASALTANDVADNAYVYGAGSGTIDDAGVDGDMIHNAKFAAARTGAGLVNVEIYYPYSDDIATNDPA